MPFRILSLSGGGMRGIFQAVYLAEIALMLDRPLREHFDLVAGTSTGSIIALGIALGIDPAKVVDLFELHGHEIFPQRTRRRSKWLMSWLVKGPRYDQKRLKAVLEETFRENGKQLQLGDCRPAIVVAATMLDRYGIRTFSTFEHFGRDGELFASDVALASAAAPLFFPAIRPRGRTKIGEVQTEQRTYVDGGVWANNPVLLAVIEAHRQRQVSFSDMRVISIGNGEVPSGAVGVDFNQMRRAKMLNPVLDMMFSTQSELADQVAALLLGDATMTGQRLLRVNAQLEKAIELDDVQEAIQKLKPLAEHEARKGFGEFKRILN